MTMHEIMVRDARKALAGMKRAYSTAVERTRPLSHRIKPIK